MKNEIRYSLAWAAAFAAEGKWLVTPQSEAFLTKHDFHLPRPHMVIQGEAINPDLDEEEAKAARRNTGGSRSSSRQSIGEAMLKSAVRSASSSIGRGIGSRIVRGILGSLFKGR